MNRARCSRRSETDRPCGIPSRGNTPPGRPQKTDPPPERERFGGGSSNIPKETAGTSRSGGCKRRRKQEAEAAESAKGRDGRFGRVNVCGSTRLLCSFEGAGRGAREASLRKVSGDDSWRAPPVPIPNTEVKPPNADGTELGTAWESRKLPGSRRSGRNESFSRSQT